MIGIGEATAPSPHVAARSQRSAPLVAAAIGAATAVFVFLAAYQALADDAFITLDYARNLAEHGHWGLLPYRSSNTATSPLNVWLLAAATVVTGRPVLAVGLVLVASMALLGWWSARLAHRLGLSLAMPTALIVLLATSPLMVSTLGMETYLGAALLIGVARYAVDGRAVHTGLIVGLNVLCRPDFAVAAGVLAAALLTWRRWFPAVATAVVVVLPWHLWSWYALGGFIPETLAFKTDSGEAVAAGLTNSMLTSLWLDWGSTPWRYWPVVLTTVTMLVGFVCALTWLPRWSQPAARVALMLPAAGVAHWLALSAAGVQAFVWYYGPLVVGTSAALAMTVALRPRAVGFLAVALTVGALVVDVSRGVPWGASPMYGNGGNARHYARVAADLNRLLPPGAVVASNGEAGTIPFFCRCDVTDYFSSRGLAQLHVDRHIARSGALMRWNYAHRPREIAPQPQWRLESRTVGIDPDPPPGVAQWIDNVGPKWVVTTLYQVDQKPL
jgi:hypothetical protein